MLRSTMLRAALMAALLTTGCTSFDHGAQSFFGAIQALDRGFQQSGVTQAAAHGLLNPYPAAVPQTTVVLQPMARQPIPMPAFSQPPAVRSPQPRSLSGMW